MRLGRWARAAGACMVASAAMGVVGATGAPTTAGAATATTDDGRAAAVELIGFIPADVRYRCVIETNPLPASVKTDPGTIRADLRCPGTDGVDVVRYYLFADNAAMNDVYTQAVGASGSQPARSADGNCPSDGTWDFSGQEAGKVGCYYATTQTDSTGQVVTEPDYAVNVWTYDAENILAVAAMPPGNSDAVALQKWWNDKAGPTKTAAPATGVVTSNAGEAQYERALRTHIPAVTSKHCKKVDTDDPANADYFTKRLWIRAAVSCTTTGGADYVVYESFDKSVVAPVFDGVIGDEQAEESSTQANSSCPDTGTYTTGKGKQARTAGKYACLVGLTSSFNNGAPYALYSWSDTKLGIIAYATATNNDPDALIQWFDGPKAGPE